MVVLLGSDLGARERDRKDVSSHTLTSRRFRKLNDLHSPVEMRVVFQKGLFV